MMVKGEECNKPPISTRSDDDYDELTTFRLEIANHVSYMNIL